MGEDAPLPQEPRPELTPGQQDEGFGAQLRVLRADLSATLRGAMALLGAELDLARRSLVGVLVLCVLLVLFLLGCWLGAMLLIVAAAYQLSGNLPISAASLIIVNGLAVAYTVWRIRRGARNLTMPRSREALRRFRGEAS